MVGAPPMQVMILRRMPAIHTNQTKRTAANNPAAETTAAAGFVSLEANMYTKQIAALLATQPPGVIN